MSPPSTVVTVTVVSPSAIPVTKPLELIVAISESSIVQLTVLIAAFVGETVAVKVRV